MGVSKQVQAFIQNGFDRQPLERIRAVAGIPGQFPGVDHTVARTVERPPFSRAPRPKQHHAGRPNRNGQVGRAGIVGDEQVGARERGCKCAKIRIAGKLQRRVVHGAPHTGRQGPFSHTAGQEYGGAKLFDQRIRQRPETLGRPAAFFCFGAGMQCHQWNGRIDEQ